MRAGSVSVGIAQNGPIGPYAPIPLSVTNANANTSECDIDATASSKQHPPNAIVNAAYRRRSCARSDNRPITKSPIAAAMYGSVNRNPVASELIPLNAAIALGSQNRNP